MKKLHIAIIDMDNLKNPYWAAGQARATREVAKLLAKKHTVTVYSSKYPGYKNYKEEGIYYKHIGIVSNNAKFTNIAFILTVPLYVHRIKADVIIENFNAPISITFSPLFTNIPVIGLPTMFNAKEFTKKYKLPFDRIEAFGSKYYKYFLPYSKTDSAKMLTYNPKIIYRIVPQGVGKEFLKIKHKKPEYILFLGRFDLHQKGVDLLIKAYAKVKDRIGYPLVIAGHGPDEQKIRDLIHKLKLDGKVTIVGAAYGKKKEDLIARALYTAYPSRHDEMSIWALESLGSGLPLICFDLPESYWMKETFSVKAKSFSINDYARSLVAATEAQRISRLRIGARRFARKYTWQHVADEFEAFIEDVLTHERKKK